MVDSTPLIPGSSSKDDKQGHRVLGCCDSRRAVIVINSIVLAISLLGFLTMAVSDKYKLTTSTIIASIIGYLFYIIVICSAGQFQYCAVMVAIIWNVADIVLVIVYLSEKSSNGTATEGDTFGTVLAMLLYLLAIYAECVYVSEVRKGIMSSETHSREAYSW